MEEKARELARSIVELFEDLLEEHGMFIPDDDRTGAEGEAPIYGVTYGNLVDDVEGILHKNGCPKTSEWGYRKGKLVCKRCGFHPTYSLQNSKEHSNANFCPNCGADMNAKEANRGKN